MDDKQKMPDKEAFIAELRKAEDPEQMSWLMANFLMDKVQSKMRQNMPEPNEDQSYGHTWDSRYSGNGSRQFHGGRYSDNSHGYNGGNYPHYTRRSHGGMERLEEYKERLGEMLGQTMTEDDIKCLICKEAASLIKKICKDEAFEAFREFSELCIGMKAYAEQYPADLEEQAKEEAIGKYVEMFQKYGRYSDSRSMRVRLMNDSEPVRRIRLDDMERSGRDLPLVEIDDFSFRSRSRDRMGRFK